MIRMGVSGWLFLLVPAYPGRPEPKAVKQLCVCVCVCVCVHACVRVSSLALVLDNWQLTPLPLPSSSGYTRGGGQALVEVSALSFLYCFDTVGWACDKSQMFIFGLRRPGSAVTVAAVASFAVRDVRFRVLIFCCVFCVWCSCGAVFVVWLVIGDKLLAQNDMFYASGVAYGM